MKIMIGLETLVHCFTSKHNKKSNNNVLIVFGGAIGDSILFLSTLKFISNYYNKIKYNIFFVGKDYVVKFVEECSGLNNIKYIGINQSMYLNNNYYFNRINNSLNKIYFKFVVSPHNSIFATFVSMNIKTQNSIAMLSKKMLQNNVVLFFLNFFAFKHKININESHMAFDNYQYLIFYLTGHSYHDGVFLLPYKKTVIAFPNKKYCVICPSANETAKCWEENKFVEIINYILLSTSFIVCISSGNEGRSFYERNRLNFIDYSRVVDYSGKLSYSDWVEIIRNSSFCFGNDSASAHIAASTGVMYYAITSGFAYGADMPYSDQSINAPFCIYSHRYKYCFGCYFKKAKRCYGNKPCENVVKHGGRYLCVSDISVEQVVDILKIKII